MFSKQLGGSPIGFIGPASERRYTRVAYKQLKLWSGVAHPLDKLRHPVLSLPNTWVHQWETA